MRCELKGPFTVRRFENCVAVAFQIAPNESTQFRLVIDDKDGPDHITGATTAVGANPALGHDGRRPRINRSICTTGRPELGQRLG